MLAVTIHWAYGVEYVLRREVSGAGSHGASGGAAADAAANLIELAHDLGTSGAMNRPVHTAAARQCRIGGVHDGIGRHACNITLL